MTLRSVFSLVFAVALSVVALPAESSAQTTTWTFCAPEGGTCVVSGTRQVRFGGNGLFASKTVTGSVACTNAVFGDPAPGVPKRCESGTTSTSTPPPTSSWSVCANEGGTCAFSGTQQVRYGASSLFAYKTLTGGTACTNAVFGDPAPGVAKQCAVGGTSSAPPPPPPPATSAYGPQASITCPAGAVSIMPGQSIQSSVNVYPGTTTFCLRAGVHYVTSSITPKTGNTFVGEYGAILDGSNWSTTDTTQAAFRAHNQDIDYVTIRNLVIRKMPQKGIHAFYWLTPDHWTIENNEITGSHTGLLFPDHSMIRNNYIHHNYGNPSGATAAERGGGYVGYYASYTTFENNEISYNGKEQKVMESTSVTFRNNFVHHNQADGIWYDGGNTGALVEGNRVEDNVRNGDLLRGGCRQPSSGTTRSAAAVTPACSSRPRRTPTSPATRWKTISARLPTSSTAAGWWAGPSTCRTTRRMTTSSASARRAARLPPG